MEKIASKTNPKIKAVAKLVSSSSFRRETGLFCIEGLRICVDAVLSDVEIRQSFFTENILKKHPESVEKIMEKSSENYVITQDIFEKISDTGSPQGVMCVCHKSANAIETIKLKKNGKYVLLENLQDPSNLGTICRTAEALGIDAVILNNCCDLFNPKVLRGSMGAVFRIEAVFVEDACAFLEMCKDKGFKTYATVPDRNATKITDVIFKSGTVCVIGNEGNGISGEVMEICHKKITIPMLGKAESLNACVAACITMWEMLR